METNCDNCNIFITKDKPVFGCSTCRCAFYCSNECFNKHNHKKDCFDMDKFAKICEKLQEARLIRHINGNTLDNRRENLEWVTVEDALVNKDWTVDAVCYLTKREFAMWKKVRALWRPDISWRWKF